MPIMSVFRAKKSPVVKPVSVCFRLYFFARMYCIRSVDHRCCTYVRTCVYFAIPGRFFFFFYYIIYK